MLNRPFWFIYKSLVLVHCVSVYVWLVPPPVGQIPLSKDLPPIDPSNRHHDVSVTVVHPWPFRELFFPVQDLRGFRIHTPSSSTLSRGSDFCFNRRLCPSLVSRFPSEPYDLIPFINYIFRCPLVSSENSSFWTLPLLPRPSVSVLQMENPRTLLDDGVPVRSTFSLVEVPGTTWKIGHRIRILQEKFRSGPDRLSLPLRSGDYLSIEPRCLHLRGSECRHTKPHLINWRVVDRGGVGIYTLLF